MAIENVNCIYVNNSNSYIPVYSSLVESQIHVGGHTAGGTQIGKIYPKEFYTLIANSSHYTTNFKIVFRNSSGQKATGYIETSKGYTLDYYGWVNRQDPYHFLNSNGSTLVNATTVNIPGASGNPYYVFTVKKKVACIDPNGHALDSLSVGTKIATNSSTPGESNKHYMCFDYIKKNGTWTKLAGSSHGFVNVGYHIGTMPSDRAIW